MILGGLESELNASLIFCLLLLFFVCFFCFLFCVVFLICCVFVCFCFCLCSFVLCCFLSGAGLHVCSMGGFLLHFGATLSSQTGTGWVG